MDSYLRDKLERIHYEYEPGCNDCKKNRPELPEDILQAAQDGKLEVIKNYINNNGDVNALNDEECLLSRACEIGQDEIVKFLLQCPNVHLNIKFEESTPLYRAALNGHLECVRLLLDAPVPCKIDHDHSWIGIAKCLELQPPLQSKTASHILRNAIKIGNRDVLRLLLQTEHHFSKDELYRLVLVAIDQNLWDLVFSVFTRDFHGRKELVNEVFYITVNMRNWKKIEEVLHVIDSELKFDFSFVKAAFAGKLPEAQRLLAESQYDSETLNGNLLVLAAGGICDPIAEMLMNIKRVYKPNTLSNALYLSALGCYAELIPRLLQNSEASFSFNDLQAANEVLVRLPLNKVKGGFLATYFNDFFKRSFMKSEENK